MLPGASMSARFPADVQAPKAARHLVVRALSQWGFGAQLCDDAALVVTELAANAVVHAGSSFSVGLRTEHDVVRISVEDSLPIDRDAADRAVRPRDRIGRLPVEELGDAGLGRTQGHLGRAGLSRPLRREVGDEQAHIVVVGTGEHLPQYELAGRGDISVAQRLLGRDHEMRQADVEVDTATLEQTVGEHHQPVTRLEGDCVLDRSNVDVSSRSVAPVSPAGSATCRRGSGGSGRDVRKRPTRPHR